MQKRKAVYAPSNSTSAVFGNTFTYLEIYAVESKKKKKQQQI